MRASVIASTILSLAVSTACLCGGRGNAAELIEITPGKLRRGRSAREGSRCHLWGLGAAQSASRGRDRAAVVDRKANMTVRGVAGMVIDFTRRFHESDQLSCFYPGAGRYLFEDPPGRYL